MAERVAKRRRDRRRGPPSTDDQRLGRGRLDPRRLLLGAKSGLVATVVMTVFRMPLADSLPPTAVFWAHVVGGEPGDHPVVGLLLHLVYGVAGGVLFAVLLRSPTVGTEAARERRGVLLGVPYAVALSVFGERVILRRLLGMDLDPDERFVFHVGHVVYGLTLGSWMGSRSDEAAERAT